ncbi:hypothetical protein GCM10009069_27030 [Algimonas arctica]|uniref:Uncharacterized protein n=1 Tax=Algimonas arctica TaxID=1479486 RepID=A0A8J3CUH7_9PROT|nr:hypothetical protein GCM10009069_27030 [Algimonas arctica]
MVSRALNLAESRAVALKTAQVVKAAVAAIKAVRADQAAAIKEKARVPMTAKLGLARLNAPGLAQCVKN